MLYEEVLANARTCVGEICKACPVCNGKACGSKIPGPGAKEREPWRFGITINGRRFS